MFQYLEYIKGRLAAIEGIKTCKIGFESSITVDSYPMIRIVPSSIRASSSINNRMMTVIVYFGLPLQLSVVGLEELTRQMFEMEQQIREVLKTGNGFTPAYVKTVFDEDRLGTPFKVMGVVITMDGGG